MSFVPKARDQTLASVASTLAQLVDAFNSGIDNGNINQSAAIAGSKLAINSVALTRMVAGIVMMYGGATAPAGSLICDGSAVSRTTYAALFTAISTAFGAGDGSTTFNLPDYRDRVAEGKSGTKALGSTGGAATVNLAHSHTVNSHTHSISTDGSHSHTVNSHTHTTPNHSHTWATTNGSGDETSGDGQFVHANNQAVQAAGTAFGQTPATSKTFQTDTSGSGTSGAAAPGTDSQGSHNHGAATGAASPGTDTQLSSAQSVLDPYQAINFIITTGGV